MLKKGSKMCCSIISKLCFSNAKFLIKANSLADYFLVDSDFMKMNKMMADHDAAWLNVKLLSLLP